jgi:toxin-antitoxin system PIN domain toxin
VIAVDTNLLVYAHRFDSVWNERAYSCLRELAEGAPNWAIPWPCLHEFLAIVTHPQIWDPPTPLHAAVEQVSAWTESPTVVLLAEGGPYWSELRKLVATARVSGSRVHDARVAALCLVHGVRELWTVDRDLSRFPSLRTRNPLAA